MYVIEIMPFKKYENICKDIDRELFYYLNNMRKILFRFKL